MSLVQVINAETTPINGQQEYSSNNNYQIIFELVGSPNQMIDLNSLRFVYNLRYTDGLGLHFNNGNVYRNEGTAGAPNQYANSIFFGTDPRTGNNGIISSVVFEDANSNILEQVNNYGHLMNKICGLGMSQDDLTTWTGPMYGIHNAGKTTINQMALNSDAPMAHRIYTGITNSKPMPFSVIGGKLKITINIVNPSQQIYGGQLNPFVVGGANNPAPLNGGAKYSIRNIKAIYRVINLDGPAPVSKGGYAYSHFSQYNQTIQSSNYQNIYNFNVSNAKCVLNSFIRSNKLNNYSANSYQSTKLQNGDTIITRNNVDDANIHETTFLKNNVKFPLDFAIDETTYNKFNVNEHKNYDTERSFYYLSCLRPVSELNNTLISGATERYSGFDQWTEVDCWNNVYGIGTYYDSLGETSNFMGGNNYLQKVQSELDGQAPNEIFTNVLSTKQLVPTASGVILQN